MFEAYIVVFLIRGIYSYKEVYAPLWVMQAFCKCKGSSLMFSVEAKLPMNCDKMSPKWLEACTKMEKEKEKTLGKLRKDLKIHADVQVVTSW